MNSAFKSFIRLALWEEQVTRDTPAHRLHTGCKLYITALYVLMVVSLPLSPASAVPYIIYPVFMAALSGVPVGALLKRLSIVLPFTMAAGAGRLFTEREIGFMIGNFAVNQGVASFTALLLKALLSVSALILLSATTPFPEINRCLAALRVPTVILLPLTMTYRYLSVLLSEAAAMRAAYIMRGSGHTGIAIKDIGVFIGQLLIRSIDRAERVYRSMQCRGFSGVYVGSGRQLKRQWQDWLFVFVFSAVFIGIRIRLL